MNYPLAGEEKVSGRLVTTERYSKNSLHLEMFGNPGENWMLRFIEAEIKKEIYLYNSRQVDH